MRAIELEWQRQARERSIQALGLWLSAPHIVSQEPISAERGAQSLLSQAFRHPSPERILMERRKIERRLELGQKRRLRIAGLMFSGKSHEEALAQAQMEEGY